MSDPSDYGMRYYCIKVTKRLSKDGEILVNADEVEIKADGSLVLWKNTIDGIHDHINLCINSGEWLCIYAASCIDGHPVAVEHWNGETKK